MTEQQLKSRELDDTCGALHEADAIELAAAAVAGVPPEAEPLWSEEDYEVATVLVEMHTPEEPGSGPIEGASPEDEEPASIAGDEEAEKVEMAAWDRAWEDARKAE